MICRLYYRCTKLDRVQLENVLFRDFGTVHQGQATPEGIFYSYFTACTLDTNHKLPKVVIAKDKNAYGKIVSLYDLVRKAFSEQGIGDIEDYTIEASGPKFKEQ